MRISDWSSDVCSSDLLDRLSRDFAAWLQSRGLRQGDRVALMLPNLLQYPVCLFGALRAGCAVVNCNPLYTAHALAHQLADSGRSEERRVGKECVSPCRSRWSPYPLTKKEREETQSDATNT